MDEMILKVENFLHDMVESKSTRSEELEKRATEECH